MAQTSVQMFSENWRQSISDLSNAELSRAHLLVVGNDQNATFKGLEGSDQGGQEFEQSSIAVRRCNTSSLSDGSGKMSEVCVKAMPTRAQSSIQ
jgi:hypothetical protein